MGINMVCRISGGFEVLQGVVPLVVIAKAAVRVEQQVICCVIHQGLRRGLLLGKVKANLLLDFRRVYHHGLHRRKRLQRGVREVNKGWSR